MDSPIKKINDLFNEHGIYTTPQELFTIKKLMKKWEEQTLNKNEYILEFLKMLLSEKKVHRLSDFEKFATAFEFDEKWRGLPNWFVGALDLNHKNVGNGIYISTFYARESIGIGYSLKELESKELLVIEERINKETKGEYQLKKVFHLENAQKMLKNWIYRHYEEIEEMSLENQAIKKFYAKIEDLIGEVYNSNKLKNGGKRK